MKSHKLIALLLSIAMAGLATGLAVAERSDGWDRKGMPAKRAGSFEASGVYTGMLSGEVEIGGKKVVIPAGVAVYHVSEGRLRGRTAAVAASYVHVSGLIKQDQNIATLIIVSESASRADYSNETQPNVVAAPNRAR